MAMSKEALNFRKEINRCVSQESSAAYIDGEDRLTDHAEYLGKDTSGTKMPTKEFEDLTKGMEL